MCKVGRGRFRVDVYEEGCWDQLKGGKLERKGFVWWGRKDRIVGKLKGVRGGVVVHEKGKVRWVRQEVENLGGLECEEVGLVKMRLRR